MKEKPPDTLLESVQNSGKSGSWLIAACLLLLFGFCLFNLDVLGQNIIQDFRLADLNKKYEELREKLRCSKAGEGRGGRILAPKSTVDHRLPQAIIIGARKCGTRALLEFLKLNSQVRTARFEVHFFDQNDTYAKGLEWYRRKMPLSHPGQITVEKTPGYFTSSLAPGRIFDMNPRVKLILLVRNPVTRTISDYTQVHYTKMSRNKTHSPFEDLVFVENTGNLNLDYKPVRNSLYVKHMRRWLRYFPLDSIHIVNGDRLISDPLPELRKVEYFLGAEPEIRASQLYFNATKGFYCVIPAPSRGEEPRCLGDSKGRPHVKVDQRVKLRLSSLLLPYSEKFFDLIQRRFDWSDF